MYTWNNKTNTSVKGNAESSYRTGQVNITPANIGLGNVGNFKAVSTVTNQGLTDTEKANARANIGAGTSSFSGNYNDLSNKPTIPAAQVNSDWNAVSGVAQILNKPTIPSIANCYQTGDTAETDLADGDYVPFYDTSVTAKRKTLWSNVKSVLKTYFDTLYTNTVANPTGTTTRVLTSLGINGTKYTIQGGVNDVSINTTGTASGTSTCQQQLTVDGESTDISGSKYMETSTYTTPSTGIRRFTFTGDAIQSTSVFDFYCDVFNVAPIAITLDTTSTTHSLAVDFNASDNVTTCRIYIRG
jgi:hypothetical protein